LLYLRQGRHFASFLIAAQKGRHPMLWNRFRGWFRKSAGFVRKHRSGRLTLEGLEHRLCPSNISITSQPANQIVAVNSAVILSAAAAGNPAPSVQWQISTGKGAAFHNISGATSDTYSFAAPAAPTSDLYRAVFTNATGHADSRSALVTVDAPPTVSTNPAAQTIDTGNTVTFTVAATGTPAPSVQWQISTDNGKDFENIPFATTDSFTFTTRPGQNGDRFRAVFRNLVGSAVTSAATLTVDVAPKVDVQPASQTTVATGSTVTLHATAEGTPAPTVQWEISTNHGMTYTYIAGATSDTYTFTAPTTVGSSLYRAVFTNPLGTATTHAARVTADIPVTVTTSPVSQEIHAGNAVTFTVAATGTPAPRVQWQISTDGGKDFENIPLANTDTLTLTARPYQNSDEFRAVFTNALGSVATSAATLAVDYGPILPPPPNTQTVATNSAVTLSVTAQGNPLPTVQWEISTNNGKTFTPISGATAYTYNFTAPSTPGTELFEAVLTNPSGSVTSPVYKVKVDAPPSVTMSPVNQSVNAGSTVTFTAAATGTPAPRVQWQISTDNGQTFSNIPLANTNTLTYKVQAGQNTDEFRAVFTDPVGQAITTAATLAVNFAPRIATQPGNQTVATGSQVTLDAVANADPLPAVQWQVSTDSGVTFTDISGATSNAYSFTAPTTPGSSIYRAVFTNTLGKATSRWAVVTDDALPTITANPVSASVAPGGSVTFTAAGTGTPLPSVQWQVSKDNGKDWSNIALANTDSVTFTATTGQNGYEFRAVFANPVGEAISSVATLTVSNPVGV
jgi:Immunoglobulin I-set domain